MKPLVIIPARGGSKGLPGKNIKKLRGKPLIHYTIEAARELFNDEQIYVSTEDENIIRAANQIGLKVPFTRPSELATDQVGTYEVLLHALAFAEENNYYPNLIFLLQPTSPFRTGQHIKEALKIYHSGLDMVVSVKETKSNPYYILFEEDENGFLKKSKELLINRRQEAPKVWEYNGAIYIINPESLKSFPLNQFRKIKKYVMDEYSSHDIDSIYDWKLAEFLING